MPTTVFFGFLLSFERQLANETQRHPRQLNLSRNCSPLRWRRGARHLPLTAVLQARIEAETELQAPDLRCNRFPVALSEFVAPLIQIRFESSVGFLWLTKRIWRRLLWHDHACVGEEDVWLGLLRSQVVLMRRHVPDTTIDVKRLRSSAHRLHHLFFKLRRPISNDVYRRRDLSLHLHLLLRACRCRVHGAYAPNLRLRWRLLRLRHFEAHVLVSLFKLLRSLSLFKLSHHLLLV